MNKPEVNGLWYWLASILIVISMGVMLWANPQMSCAVGFCNSRVCWTNVNCGSDCFCLKRSGATSGECYQR